MPHTFEATVPDGQSVLPISCEQIPVVHLNDCGSGCRDFRYFYPEETGAGSMSDGKVFPFVRQYHTCRSRESDISARGECARVEVFIIGDADEDRKISEVRSYLCITDGDLLAV